DYPYNVNIIKTIQPSTKPNEEDLGLIIDIDVFTTKKLPIDCDILLGHLEEMRWLKNKVFFGNITENLREALK
ncbi:MAG: TIGR04255 family protein, partial [Syntrophorhabdus sp.]